MKCILSGQNERNIYMLIILYSMCKICQEQNYEVNIYKDHDHDAFQLGYKS